MAFVPGSAALPRAVGAPVGDPDGDVGMAPALGRVTDPATGRIVSARLNPDIAVVAAEATLEEKAGGTIDRRLEQALSMGVLPISGMSGGGRKLKQRGGGLSPEQRKGIALLTTTAIVAGAAAYIRGAGVEEAVAAWGIAGSGLALLAGMAGEEKTKAGLGAVGTYADTRGATKVAQSLGRAGETALDFSDNVVKLAFALIRLPIAGTSALVGTAGKLLGKVAEKAQTAADKLENPATHEYQADLIIQNGTLAFTAALAALVASGALPLMTIFSVMLWTGKLYMSPVGRAVGIIELYVWWINQSDSDKKKTEAQVKAFVEEAKKGGKVTAEWVDANAGKMSEAIAHVGGKLGTVAKDFGAGFAAGIDHPENPLINALSLGFVRAAGLAVDDKNVPKPQPEENKSDLARLADAIVKGARPTIEADGTIDLAKIEAAVETLKKLQGVQERVAEAKAGLAAAEAKAARVVARLGGPGAAVGGPGADAPAERGVKRRGVTGASEPERTADEGPDVAASGIARPAPAPAPAPAEGRPKRSRAAPTGGARRKTRRKRPARRMTKKVKTKVRDFYY